MHHPANLAIAFGHFRLDAVAADMNIATMLVGARHPQGTSQRLAVQHDQPLVALANLRDISLAHDWPRLELRYRPQDRIQIPVAAVRVKPPFTAVPVERFDDHLTA